MTISMFKASAPQLAHGLGNLKAVLAMAAAHAEARKINPEVLAASRLFPDMLPLSAQVQIACDMAKGGLARLSGTTAPEFKDDEKNLAELIARCEKTIAYIKSFKPAQIDGTEEKEIVLAFPSRTFKFNGQDYLTQFVLPNFYFHLATAYGLLRHGGVELGKKDFLGNIG